MTNLETGTFNKLFDGISDDMEISGLMTFLSPNVGEKGERRSTTLLEKFRILKKLNQNQPAHF